MSKLVRRNQGRLFHMFAMVQVRGIRIISVEHDEN